MGSAGLINVREEWARDAHSSLRGLDVRVSLQSVVRLCLTKSSGKPNYAIGTLEFGPILLASLHERYPAAGSPSDDALFLIVARRRTGAPFLRICIKVQRKHDFCARSSYPSIISQSTAHFLGHGFQ
jgi:hypothetical protein